MNLHQLETFIRVAELGSFSKAALVMNVAQPALSRQVRALETDLRETLLLRNGRGVTLTEAGRRLLEHGQAILHLVTQAQEDLSAYRHEPVGQITVAMPPTQAKLLTGPLIQGFKSLCPRARLAVMEGFSAHITEWLVSGRADVALVYNPEPLPALDILPLRQERLCLFSPKDAAPPGPVSLQDLGRYPLVMPQRGHIFRKLLESAMAMAGVAMHVEWEVSSVPVILELVAEGLGHAALGEDAWHYLAQPDRVVATPFSGTDIVSTLCLVTPAQKRSTPLMQRTAQLLMKLGRGDTPAAQRASGTIPRPAG